MTLTTPAPAADTGRLDVGRWSEPAGITPRGTVLLLAGRGEPPAVYARFGARIAADGYRVVAVGGLDPADAAGRAEVAGLAAGPERPAPLVLAGSDSGAWAALRLLADGEVAAEALVLAGLPVAAVDGPPDWSGELERRTACPNHQGVLRRSAQSLAFFPVAVPTAPAPGVARPAVPVLALHGDDDRISPLAEAAAHYRAAGADFRVVRGGRHDILNDVSHRSVAATVVLFLERLRLGADAPLIISADAPPVLTAYEDRA